VAVQHSSRIELSESALRRNIHFLRQHLGPQARFSSVVKGNAYGHSIEAFVPLAEKCGIRHFSVFSAVEAQRVLHVRAHASDVLVMGDIDDDELEWAIENNVAYYVFEPARLAATIRAGKKLGRPARIHIELETGLNRSGFRSEQLLSLCAQLRTAGDVVDVEGVCTHYAGAESVGNYLRVQQQTHTYTQMLSILEANGVHARIKHVACSAAALTYPETIRDMVRFGIAQYGFWPSKETQMHYYMRDNQQQEKFQDPLRRVLRWVSRIVHINDIKPGDFVGYGTSYQSTRREKIAVVPVGYFLGFPRGLSNLGHVLVCGRRAPVVGMVNMNVTMVDVTDIPGVERGDEVVVIGRQGRAQITVSSFSDMSRFLNYEVLARIPAEIPRIVVK
jgi:alanine racemase